MKPALQRTLWILGLSGACALVFAAYLQPDMLVTLATAVWNCF